MRSASLGGNAVPFQLLRQRDLPSEWLVEVSQGAIDYAAAQLQTRPELVAPRVAVELPDFPWAWAYQRWAEAQNDPEALAICITNWDDYRNLRQPERSEAVSACLRSFIEIGRPAPFFVRGFYLRDTSA